MFTPTSRIVRHANAALHCSDQGSGPPVVFLASWSLPGVSWRRQVDAFCAAGLRCITYDRRGHGRSPDPGGGYDFDTLDFRDELSALRLPVLVIQGEEDVSSPPHLTGHPTATLVPGARLITYPDAPHGLCVSHPDRLNADLLSFIRNELLDGRCTHGEP